MSEMDFVSDVDEKEAERAVLIPPLAFLAEERALEIVIGWWFGDTPPPCVLPPEAQRLVPLIAAALVAAKEEGHHEGRENAFNWKRDIEEGARAEGRQEGLDLPCKECGHVHSNEKCGRLVEVDCPFDNYSCECRAAGHRVGLAKKCLAPEGR